MTTEQPPYDELELYVVEEEEPPSLRFRYEWWAAHHTMNPLAWPWVIYMSIVIYLDKRAHKDD